MRKHLARIRSVGFIVWHARHMLYHVLLGCLWVLWTRRQFDISISPALLTLSIAGSLVPDMEHIVYFFTYGKRDMYTKEVARFIRHGDWRILTLFIEKGHKYNTQLKFHTIYTVFVLMLCMLVSGRMHQIGWFVFFGAMVIHYLFDIADDIATIGKINVNWYRWGKAKKKPSKRLIKSLQKAVMK